MTENGDTWFESVATEDSSWVLPPGAVLVNAASIGVVPRFSVFLDTATIDAAAPSITWTRVSEDGDVWYEDSNGNLAWTLPPNAIIQDD